VTALKGGTSENYNRKDGTYQIILYPINNYLFNSHKGGTVTWYLMYHSDVVHKGVLCNTQPMMLNFD
jgi:hypothetical protein